jgi:hypothetical protein
LILDYPPTTTVLTAVVPSKLVIIIESKLYFPTSQPTRIFKSRQQSQSIATLVNTKVGTATFARDQSLLIAAGLPLYNSAAIFPKEFAL